MQQTAVQQPYVFSWISNHPPPGGRAQNVRSAHPQTRTGIIPRSAYGVNRRRASPKVLEDREVALQLERRDVGLVGVPFLTFVAQQELQHVVAERRAEHIRALGEVDRLDQIPGQRQDAGHLALVLGHLVDVVRGLRREFVLALEAGQPRGDDRLRSHKQARYWVKEQATTVWQLTEDLHELVEASAEVDGERSPLESLRRVLPHLQEASRILHPLIVAMNVAKDEEAAAKA
jgi:hypothetical protein